MMLGAQRAVLVPFRFPAFGVNLRKGSYLAAQAQGSHSPALRYGDLRPWGGHCEPFCRYVLMVGDRLCSAKRCGNLQFIGMDKGFNADCHAPLL